jgi:transglutaminase-like putative cysteine protease
MFFMFRLSLSVAILVLASSLAAADDAAPLNPAQPYAARRSSPVTYDVDFSVVVTPPNKCKELRVWLPIPQSDNGQQVSGSELTTFPMNVKPDISTEEQYGNKFAFFAFEKAQGAQIIRHRFKIKVWQLDWGLRPENVLAIDQWPQSFERYRRGEDQAVVVDARFREFVDRIVAKRRDPLHNMMDVMSWVNDHFTYDHVHASLQASADQAIETQRGHCSDYHGFCASMGRAMGYPTRVTYGINAFPKNSPSHCKLEVYLPPAGWVSFDVSETQRLMQKVDQDQALSQAEKQQLKSRAQRRLYEGFRDNTWYLQTRGTDYDLSPKAARRVAVVRTIYAEADGVALPEPDPANNEQRQFSWMTAHKYVPDVAAKYPFDDYDGLRAMTD